MKKNAKKCFDGDAMELIRGLHNIRSQHFGCVLSIGNFDGVHLGHIALLKKLKEQAAHYQVPSVVILFEPQPNEYFAKSKVTTRLMKLREKLVAIANEKIDRVLCIRFNEEFANMTAHEFIETILVNQLGVKAVIIGDDFHFGYQRQGNVDLLQKLGKIHHFKTLTMPTFFMHKERVSSTRIRDYLAVGDMKNSAELLGKAFTMMGRIIHGDKRGRIMGFPTANIQLQRKAVPLSGVFVVRVYGIEKHAVQGVANIGSRPTVNGTRTLLEIHLFDFDRMIYGEHIEVEFIHKLRDEERFPSFEDLVQQIHQDVKDAKSFFQNLWQYST